MIYQPSISLKMEDFISGPIRYYNIGTKSVYFPFYYLSSIPFYKIWFTAWFSVKPIIIRTFLYFLVATIISPKVAIYLSLILKNICGCNNVPILSGVRLEISKKECFYKYFWTVIAVTLRYVNYITIISMVVEVATQT